MTTGRFIAGIGALIWNPRKEAYLLLRRSDKKEFAPGAWECVTGRLEQGEGFEDAVHREVAEELGVSVRLNYLLGTTHFYRGPKRPEVELIGVVYGCTLEGNEDFRLSQEHSEARWLSAEEARKFLSPQKAAEGWLLRVLDRDALMRRLVPPPVLLENNVYSFVLDD